MSANEKSFKGKEVYFTDAAMYEERGERQRSENDKKKEHVRNIVVKQAKTPIKKETVDKKKRN